MKILFITESLPYFPCHDGFRLIPYNLLRELSNEHEIHLLSFITDKKELEGIPSIKDYCASIDTVHFHYPKTVLERFRSMCSMYAFDEAMAQKIQEVLEREKIDAIHVEGANIGQYVHTMDHMPKIICPHDSPSFRSWQLLISQKGLLNKVKWFLQWLKSIYVERTIYPRFNQCVVVSPKDQKEIQKNAPGLNITVMSNGVDMSYYAYKPYEGTQKYVIFTGSMSYTPNVDACLFFYREMFPLIRKEDKDIKFYVVGANPIAEIEALKKDPDVVVTGKVDDIREYIYKSAVYVCPMRYGTGIKNKVLEAMSLGAAIVSSSNSVIGINVTDEENILIADEPVDFAKKTVALLNDPEKRLRLAKNARKIMEDEYSWRSRAEEISTAYKRITKNGVSE